MKRLVKQGLVTYASNHIVRPAQPSPPAPLPNGEGSTSSSRSAPLLEGGEGQVADKRVSDLFRWPEPARKRKRSEQARPRVVGVFHRTQKGFGFVRPLPPAGEEGDRKAKDDPKADDIFVPAKYTLDAAGGDVVAVEVKERQAGST